MQMAAGAPQLLPAARAADPADDADEGDAEPVLHLVVAAAGRLPPQTQAPRSVFELCASQLPAKRLVAGLRPAGQVTSIKCVERDGDRVRVVHVRPEQTAAWQEQEQRRRAKQRPPKPTKRYKRKGKKLVDLVGVDG
jgi:hypothetical protein